MIITLASPVPEKVCVTVFTLLVNVAVPEAVPGEPEAGVNVTLKVWDCPAARVSGKVAPLMENALPPPPL